MSSSTINQYSTSIKDLWTVLEEEAVTYKSSANYDAQSGHETTLVFLGPKSSGKTTLLNKFLDKGTESPKCTIGLDYTYGRRVRASSNVKDVVHIWDIGGGESLTKLMQVPISSSSVHTTTCIICVDLSKPCDLISTLDHYVTSLHAHVNELLTGLEKRGSKRPKGLRQLAMKKYPVESSGALTLIPMQWALVATKYDQIQTHAPELRRLMLRLVRYYAHVYGGSLLVTSVDDVTKAKQLLGHYGFKTVQPKPDSKNLDRPVYIVAGTDSLPEIFPDSCSTLNELALQFSAFAAQNAARVSDVAMHVAFSPKFAEPLIDQECVFN